MYRGLRKSVKGPGLLESRSVGRRAAAGRRGTPPDTFGNLADRTRPHNDGATVAARAAMRCADAQPCAAAKDCLFGDDFPPCNPHAVVETGSLHMTTFDKREEGFERKFALDEELRFRATARRNKILGLWAAGRLGKAGADAEGYAKSVVLADFEEIGDDDV